MFARLLLFTNYNMHFLLLPLFDKYVNQNMVLLICLPVCKYKLYTIIATKRALLNIDYGSEHVSYGYDTNRYEHTIYQLTLVAQREKGTFASCGTLSLDSLVMFS